MMISALTGVIFSAWTQSAGVGLLCAMVIGMLVALMIGFFALILKTDIILAGIAVNMLGSGGTILFMYLASGDRGYSANLASKVMPSIDIPLIKDIPVLGQILSGHNVLTYVALLCVFLVWVLLYKTPLGLQIRSVGENPNAADSVGVSVQPHQLHRAGHLRRARGAGRRVHVDGLHVELQHQYDSRGAASSRWRLRRWGAASRSAPS